MYSQYLSIAATAALLLQVANAANTQCVLKSNPPAGANCGVIGYLRNEYSIDTYSYDSQKYGTPEKCAKGCAERGNCVSWYLGRYDYNLFCEWHTDTTAAAEFYPDSSSFYYGYDQSCFTCGPASLCPDLDGTQYTVGGSVFNIHCGTDFYGGDLARVTADTFESCLASCASTMGCVDVAYNGNNCYMKSSVTSARKDSNVMGAILVSAEQAAANRLSCPRNDGATFTAKSGDVFTVQCGVDYFGGDLSSLYAETLEDCLNACGSTSGCVDVAYHASAKYCYLKNVITAAEHNSETWGAVKTQPARSKKRSDGPPTSKAGPIADSSVEKRSGGPPTSLNNPFVSTDADQGQ